MEGKGYEPVVENTFYAFGSNDQDLFELLSEHEAFRFVQDLVDDNKAEVSKRGAGKKLILSSPNSATLRTLHNDISFRFLYMPIWSEEELQNARKDCFPHLTAEYVTQQFEIYGGIPRIVFEYTAEHARVLLNRQIREIHVNTVFSIMSKRTYTERQTSETTFILIHVSLDRKFGFKSVFSTEVIACKLAEEFLDDSNFSVQNFVNQAKSISEMGAWQGYLLEALAHRVFVKGEHTFKLFLLGEGRIKPKPVHDKEIEIKFEHKEYFSDVSTIVPLKSDVYYIPKKKNEYTIDSFAIVPRSFIETKFPKCPQLKKHPHALLFILAIQVIVSKEYVVDGTYLSHLRSVVREKMNENQVPFVFVFVTEPGGIENWQSVTHLVEDTKRKAAKSGDRKERIRKSFDNQAQFGNQYACYIGSEFAEIKKLWAEPKTSAFSK